MKLVTLTLTPNGNERGAVIEVAIDHDPETFKPCYVHVIRMMDGSHHLLEYPPNIDKATLKQAVDQAYVIIDMVYDLTSGL